MSCDEDLQLVRSHGFTKARSITLLVIISILCLSLTFIPIKGPSLLLVNGRQGETDIAALINLKGSIIHSFPNLFNDIYAVSPDGASIVYYENDKLMILKTYTGKTYTLKAKMDISNLTWSSDNKSLYIVHRISGSDIQVVDRLYPADSSRQLLFKTKEPNTQINSVKESPDNGYLAIELEKPNNLAPFHSVHLVKTDGSLERGRLIANNAYLHDWLPDGNIVIQPELDEYPYIGYLQIVNLQGKNLNPYPGNKTNILWSPDHSKVVIDSWYQEEESFSVLNNKGTVLYHRKGDVWNGDFTWSPDSKYLAFSTDDGLQALTDNGSVVTISKKGGISSWSPTGEYILLEELYNEDLSQKLWLINFSTRKCSALSTKRAISYQWLPLHTFRLGSYTAMYLNTILSRNSVSVKEFLTKFKKVKLHSVNIDIKVPSGLKTLDPYRQVRFDVDSLHEAINKGNLKDIESMITDSVKRNITENYGSGTLLQQYIRDTYMISKDGQGQLVWDIRKIILDEDKKNARVQVMWSFKDPNDDGSQGSFGFSKIVVLHKEGLSWKVSDLTADHGF